MKNLTITRFLLLALLCCASIPLAAVNYDTAWTFVYDGGRTTKNGLIVDDFRDVKALPDGSTIYVGKTGDSTEYYGFLLMKLDKVGKIVFKKKISAKNTDGYDGNALCIAKNGDFIIGGMRWAYPWLVRTDNQGNPKWETWFYDSTNKRALLGAGNINCVKETRHGTIICAVGEQYPPSGSTLKNYGTILQFDSTGKYVNGAEKDNVTGIKAGGFWVEDLSGQNYLLAGNQTLFSMDSSCKTIWNKSYTFSLSGVGSVTNNIMRVKMLRDGSLMALGQAYEEDCWDNWQKYYWDVWYSPISFPSGINSRWLTAGADRADDIAYDFTQLVNGDLVFVGNRGDRNNPSAIWVLVTDSTGVNVLMDKYFYMPCKFPGRPNSYPFAVTATADTGFTVAGKGIFDTLAGWDGFAAHFVPAPVVRNVKRIDMPQAGPNIRSTIHGSKVVFYITGNIVPSAEIVIYNAAGKKVATALPAGNNEMFWDCRGMAGGVYMFTVKQGRAGSTWKSSQSSFHQLLVLK